MPPSGILMTMTGTVKEYMIYNIEKRGDKKMGVEKFTLKDGVLTIANGVTEISEKEFCRNKEIKSVVIPGSVKKIGAEAFAGCSNLTTVTISEGVKRICEHAFKECTNLEEVKIPDSVECIEDGAFWLCANLTKINLPEGILSIGGSAFSFCKSLAAVEIPQNVHSIGAHTFTGCSKLKTINVPEGVQSIGYAAFRMCISLKIITIPRSVTFIDGEAFGGCKKLKKIIYGGTKEEWKNIRKPKDEDGRVSEYVSPEEDFSGPTKILKEDLSNVEIIFENPSHAKCAKNNKKDGSMTINCLEGLIESIAGGSNTDFDQRLHKLAEHMVSHSFFFPKEIVDEQHEKMISALKNKEVLPARYSESDECYCYADGTMPKFKNKDEAVKESKASDVFFKFIDNKIPVIIDKDGNYSVRQLITETTGHKISQGATSTITYATISHIWGKAFNPIFFTSLWNIVIVPTYCNPILDKDDESKGDDIFAKEVAYINKVYKKICYEYYDVKSKLEDFNKLGFDITPDVPCDDVDFSIEELPFIPKFEKRKVAKAKSQKGVKSTPQKQVSTADSLQKYLKSIVMGVFVNFYENFADPQYTTADIKSLLRTTYGHLYSSKSINTMASVGRSIIDNGFGPKALERIAKSTRVDEDTRQRAKELLSLEP